MPPRNVVPKPLQKPHPPLWVACSRRDTIHLAATKGIGALSFAFIEADEARMWVDDYYATIASEENARHAPRTNLGPEGAPCRRPISPLDHPQ
jgi:alkanesulfonate monooxygenase SsuD/methylene tetrahydromethanopterin reductase-like flavin-dependent oxidoreductase (luciferase family)